MWIFYAIGATVAVSASDAFRKLGSNLNDPFFANVALQAASLTTAVVLWLIFSRHVEHNQRGLLYAALAGILLSVFTTLLFKSFELGPGISTVIPIVRIGGVILVVLIGLFFFKDKFSWSLAGGIALGIAGMYLIFSGK